MEVNVYEGQTIWDLTLQEYGSVEGIFDLLALNPEFQTLNVNLVPGIKVSINEVKENKLVADYYSNNKVIVVSEIYTGSTGSPFTDDFNCDFDGGAICETNTNAFSTAFNNSFN